MSDLLVQGEVVDYTAHGEPAAEPVAQALDEQVPLSPEELKASIMKQIEFYFSDANLPTDKHLLKQIQKDPDGCGRWMDPKPVGDSGP